jgi:hypothetical protein
MGSAYGSNTIDIRDPCWHHAVQSRLRLGSTPDTLKCAARFSDPR